MVVETATRAWKREKGLQNLTAGAVIGVAERSFVVLPDG